MDGLVHWIDVAAEQKLFSSLQISGGEPFAVLKSLQRLLECSHANRLDVEVHTNAFWACSMLRAEKTLAKLNGLTSLIVSTDIYHEEFIHLQNVSHALNAAVKFNIPAKLVVCTWNMNRDAFYSRLMDTVGVKLLKKIEVIHNQIEPIGRGQNLPQAALTEYSNELPQGRCTLLDRHTVTEDGTLTACCNLTVALDQGATPLRLGDVMTEGLSPLFQKADQDWLLQALRTGGPAYLAELVLQVDAEAKLPGQYRKDSICDLCKGLWRHPSTLKTIRELMQSAEIKQEIAAMRAWMLDEKNMLEAIRVKIGRGESVSALQ